MTLLRTVQPKWRVRDGIPMTWRRGRWTLLLGSLLLPGCAAAQVRIRQVETKRPAPACAGNPSADTTVRDGGDLSSPPDLRVAAFALYNPRSIPSGQERYVVLRYVVSADGSVDSTRVVAASTNDSSFIPLARQTLLQAQFWPACIGDTAVATWAQQRYRYVHK